MNKKRLWTRGAAWLLTLCLLAGLCVPTVRAEGETEPTGADLGTEQSSTQGLRDDSIAVQGTGTETSITGLGVEGLGVSYVFSSENDSYKASLIGPTAGSGQLSIGTQSGQFIWRYYYGEVVLTLTNTLSTNAVLSFKSSSSGAGESFFNEAGLVPSYSGELKAGDSVTFRIRSAKTSNGKKSGILLTLDGIKLEPIIAKRTTSFLPMSHGSYTVDGENVVTEMTKELESNKSFHLNATPDRGYILAGWQKKLEVDGTATVSFLTDENPYDYYPQEDATIQPVFVPADSAIYMVGTTQFVDLNYANDYAVAQNISTIVLEKSGTVPAGDYEISKGVSLLIPYSDSTTLHISEPTTTKDQNGPSGQTPYRTLTMKEGATIRVYGTINVDSEVTGNRSEPTGPYGYIVMESDSHIILESGANLACWGFISGDGEVRAKSGSTVYECFQMPGWRGGSVSQKMTGNKQHIFPVNKYAVQNIETSYAMESGATEKIYASVYLKQSEYLQGQGKSTTDFIATDSGMFRLKSGELVRKYSPSEDRVNYDVNGELVISQLVLNLSITIGITLNIRLDTQEYVMPLSGNFTININKGTTSIDGVQDLSLMPGTKFIVSKGATFKCSSALFVYDHEAYIGKSYAYPNDTATIPYSPTKGYTRKADLNDMPDAEIDVNGTLLITNTGTLYTTVKLDSNGSVDPDKLYGANIHSSQGTGSIVFQGSADSSKTVYEFKGNDASAHETVPITPARLRNGDGSYVETSSVEIQDGVAWTYFYDRGATEQWYRFKIQFVMADKPEVIVYQELVASTTASVKLPGLSGTVTTEISGGTATSEWDASNKTLTLKDIKPTTFPEDGSAPVLKVKVTAAVNSYKPYFVLNEKQYGNYRSYTGKTLTDTVDIGGKTYYVVQSSEKLLKFGEKLTGPTKESMGVSDGNHNGITWFLEDTTTGAQVFGGTVPSGEIEGGPVYIYGIYSGYEVKVTRNGADEYYTTLKEAVTALPQTGSATVQMLANCGTFEDESKTASYSFIANITFDLNGKEVWGSLVNNGTLTIRDSTHSETNDGTGKVTSASNNTITNAGTLTLESGKFVSTGGATAVKNNGTLNVDTGAAFKGKNNDRSQVISGEANYPDGYQLSTSPVEGYFRVVLAEVTITWIDGDGKSTTSRVKQGEVPKYPGTENPVKTPGAGENCKYKFTGWKPELTAATEDAEYKAQFETIDKIRMTSGDTVDYTVDYFNTLQEAIDQSPKGATLTLQKPLDAASGTATFTKTLTLELNGQTSSGNITVNSGVTLTIEGTGTISASGTAVLNKGTLILPTGITVEATGNNGIALDNSGTIDSITGGTFTGHVAVQVDGTGSITKISGGDFISSGNGGHAVNVVANGTIGTISGGTFKADMDSHVLVNKNTPNPIKLEGTARFGGVSLRSGVMEPESSFTFNDGYTLSTKPDEDGYFTIVANTFQITFNVNGKNEETVEVSRANNSIDLQSLYGSKKPSKGEGYQFTGWSLTQNGAALETTRVTQAQLGNPGTGDTVTVYATWNVVYRVTITWGSLEYEYKGATYVWDSQNMKYTVKKGAEAHWESVNNTVTVKNDTVATEGTVRVKAKYEKTGGYTFDLLLQQNNTSLTKEQVLGTVKPKGKSQSWSFLLDGTPSGNAFTNATVGKITLTLQPAT